MIPPPEVAATSSLLRAHAVHVWYERGLPHEKHALRGVDAEVRAGDRVGLLGASGSGKSTLLHVLARLQSPTQGHVASSLSQLPSLVFQFPERQLFAESVADEVAYGLAASGVTRTEIAARVDGALTDVGLSPDAFAQRTPFRLSGGERRRVALAAILAQRRRVVLLDEPTLGLDRDGTRRLAAMLATLHERNVAYWVASHDTDFIAEACGQLVVLSEGAVVYRGLAESYWTDPERSERDGVRPPRAAALASRLGALDVTGLPARPTARQIAAALAAVRHKHEPPG